MTTTGGEPAFLTGLNDAQRDAVLHDSGPLAVLAGPGTGKTRVIVHRVARAVAPESQGGLGAKPESVLALAFTIKSAEELRNRLAQMFADMGLPQGYAERVRAGTVHSFGSNIVRRFADRLNLPSNLTVMDSAQQRRMLRDLIWSSDLFKHLAAQGRETAVEGAMRFIAACRNDAVTPERAAEWIKRRRDLLARGIDPETDKPFDDAERGKRLLAEQPTHEDHAKLLALYDQRCAKEGAITLDDFISLPAKLLREDSGVAAILRDEHRHIVVDEFQDWNVAQIELLTLLAPAARENSRPSDVCVVGDDDQSIYAFRGADDRAFERFAKHYPNYTQIALTKNYRSARVIIETANEIIARAGTRFAPDKAIEPGDPDNPKFAAAHIEGVTTAKGESDGAAIAAMILLDRAENDSRKWSDFAVIARSGTHLDQIGAELELQGIPVAVRDGAGALEDEFVEDLRAWEEAIADPLCAAGGSPRRILWRAPIGMRIEDIQRYEREHASMQRENEEPRPYLDWLVAAHAGDPKVARFREVYDKCRAHAAEHNADIALDLIAREAVLPVFDALDPDDRLRSGLWLVKYIAFVRDKQDNLPAPGDLQAWRAYWDDLDDKERSRLALGGAERVVRTGNDEEDADNAVQLITAHSAKGLEFDTVFLPRVRPGIGMYPSSLSGDDDALAPDLAAREGTSAGDEERRLFYVACTRAERRLVVLAKEKKSKSEGKFGDYFLELTEFADPETRVPVIDAAQWIERAGAHMHAPGDALDAAGGSNTLDRLLRDARRDAASLLFAAQSAETEKDALLKVEHDLAHLARRIAVLGRLRAGGIAHMPAFLRDAADNDARLRKFIEQASSDAGVVTFAPRKPPLKLSYSTITDFEMCGLCFYVKYVLGLDEPKTTALAVGGVAHLALEKFYKERRAAEAEGVVPPGRERLLELGAVEFERQSPRDAQGRREMRDKITGMLEHAYDDLHNDADEVLETELSIRMRFRLPDEPDDAPAHQFIAKIDRVDRTPSGGFRVVDYKTGAATKTKLEIPKTDLQMSIYALALSVWLNADMPANGEAFDAVRLDQVEPIEGEAQYWVLSEGERGSIPFSSLNLEKAAEKVHAAARAMLDGKYEKGKNCKGLCAYIGR